MIVHYDSPMTDDERRERLFRGEIFIYSPTQHTLALIEHARTMIEQAFGSRNPEFAQYNMDVADFASLLGKMKPAFIHHPRSKQILSAMLDGLGADIAKTYFDVPKMRSATSDDYLTTGIAHAFPPHRDCWYAGPFSQINYWMPVYPLTPDNGMAFYPEYFENPIKNNSEVYNYYRWNKSRATAHLDLDGSSRIAPEAKESVTDALQVRYVVPPGGLIVFAGAQLHQSLPNASGRTRYSIDFRTVHYDDVAQGRGVPNVDTACEGTALRDFLRATDYVRLPEEMVAPYDSGQIEDGVLIYEGQPPAKAPLAGLLAPLVAPITALGAFYESYGLPLLAVA